MFLLGPGNVFPTLYLAVKLLARQSRVPHFQSVMNILYYSRNTKEQNTYLRNSLTLVR